VTIAARLDMPDDRPGACAIFAHCFTCSKDLKVVRILSSALTHQGIAVLRFDFTGLGESGGEFADTNFSSNVQDLIDAAQWLATEYEAPQLLIGHSLGGAAVLLAAHGIPSAKAVVTVGAPCDPSHVSELFTHVEHKIAAAGEAQVMLAGRPFTIKQQFLDDLNETNLSAAIAKLGRALLVCHGPLDQTVGIENAGWIYGHAKHPKSFLSLDGADHLISRAEDARYLGSVIAAWASKYIELHSRGPVYEEPDERWVEVKTGKQKYRSEVSIGKHHFLADEPTSVGGQDLGPTPYELLGAALGACTAMTLRMYADRKKWPVDSISVRLKHDKVHATDCEECETERGKIDRIQRVVSIEGDIDESQRARMMAIADKCPVHRSLNSEIWQPTAELAD